MPGAVRKEDASAKRKELEGRRGGWQRHRTPREEIAPVQVTMQANTKDNCYEMKASKAPEFARRSPNPPMGLLEVISSGYEQVKVRLMRVCQKEGPSPNSTIPAPRSWAMDSRKTMSFGTTEVGLETQGLPLPTYVIFEGQPKARALSLAGLDHGDVTAPPAGRVPSLCASGLAACRESNPPKIYNDPEHQITF